MSKTKMWQWDKEILHFAMDEGVDGGTDWGWG